MRAIVVDDEPFMLKRFARLAFEISDLNIVGQFTSAEKALYFANEQHFEVAFLDVEMPIKNGVQLAMNICGTSIRSEPTIIY